MDAIGEPYALQVHFHTFEISSSAVHRLIRIDGFKRLANQKVEFTKLVGSDITTDQCGFRQKEDILLLRQGQVAKSGEPIAEHL